MGLKALLKHKASTSPLRRKQTSRKSKDSDSFTSSDSGSSTSTAELPLPIELIYYIFDFLLSDKRALGTCGLACRSWLPRVRHLLFRKLTITADPHAAFHPFLCTLHQSDGLGAHIEELELVGRRTLESRVYTSGQLCSHTLTFLISKLPNLQKFRVKLATFAHSEATTSSHLRYGRALLPKNFYEIGSERTATPSCQSYSAIPSWKSVPLQELGFWGCGGATYSAVDFVKVLSLFSDVGLLSINGFSMNYSSLDYALDVARGSSVLPHLRVNSLIVFPPIHAILPLIRHSPTVQTLTVLSAECRTWSDVYALGDLLRETGGSLKRLYLDLCHLPLIDDFIPDAQWQALSLSSLTRLQNLSLKLTKEHITDLNPTQLHRLYTLNLDLLSLIPRRALREVGFNICIENAGELGTETDNFMDWKRLEDLLCEMPRLRKFNFVVRARSYYTTKGWRYHYLRPCPLPLKERMPRLDEALKLVGGVME